MTRLVAIGGSDAGISAALRARELDPTGDVTVVLADAYPNFSICGIPYYVSGEVSHWRNLAHRTLADLTETGMTLHLDTRATRIDPDDHSIEVIDASGREQSLPYDELILGTGALPVRPPIEGLDTLRPRDGVHLLHSMGDTFALMGTLEQPHIRRAVIVGAGYIGLEIAEALTARGLHVTQLEQLPEVLPTVDPELGALVHQELERNQVDVHCSTRVRGDPRGAPRIIGTPASPRDRRRRASADVRRGRRARRRRSTTRQPARRDGRSRTHPEERDRHRPPDAHQPARRLRRRGLRPHLPPPHRTLGTSRSARPPTNKAASPPKTRSGQAASSPAASAPRSSRSSSSSRRAPAYATTKPAPSTRSP